MAKGGKRLSTGTRPIPGLGAPGSKSAGSSKQLPAGATPSSKQPGPNLHRQRQNTSGGPGSNVNSQPTS